MNAVRNACLLLWALQLVACVDNERRVDTFAVDHGFERQVVAGAGFRHVLYRNSGSANPGALHIYIEGDGMPFETRDRVAVDPTPRNLLMLKLMQHDSTASIYIGRPCYFGLSRDGQCGPIWWTARRYSAQVVASMIEVIKAQSAAMKSQTIEIYGHSGGGTIALLIAEQTPGISRVVTLGANLDVAAWTRLHGYTPLDGSLNPIDTKTRRSDLRVLHLVGSRDTNTPPWLILEAARIRGGEDVRVIPGFDHVCCWEPPWPKILSDEY